MNKKDKAVDTLLDSLNYDPNLGYVPSDLYRLSAKTLVWIANKVEALKPVSVAAKKPSGATQATNG